MHLLSRNIVIQCSCLVSMSKRTQFQHPTSANWQAISLSEPSDNWKTAKIRPTKPIFGQKVSNWFISFVLTSTFNSSNPICFVWVDLVDIYCRRKCARFMIFLFNCLTKFTRPYESIKLTAVRWWILMSSTEFIIRVLFHGRIRTLKNLSV